jgi:hypothetical protein
MSSQTAENGSEIMQAFFYPAYRPIAAALVAATLLFGPAGAQSQELNPETLDVGGVKLGMTPGQASEALKGFDPALAVTEKYLTGRGLSYGLEGASMDAIPDADKRTAYLDGLVAAKGAPKTVCNETMTWCHPEFADDEETIKVWFSRVSGQEQVIAVQRYKVFHNKPQPAIPTLKAAIFDKYPESQVTFQRGDGLYYTIGWLFDSRKRMLSRVTAKSKGLQESGALPGTVHADDGIGLNVVFVSNNQNAQIAESFSQTLYDANGLFKSIEQSKSAYDALKAKADAKQLEESRKNPGQTKF